MDQRCSWSHDHCFGEKQTALPGKRKLAKFTGTDCAWLKATDSVGLGHVNAEKVQRLELMVSAHPCVGYGNSGGQDKMGERDTKLFRLAEHRCSSKNDSLATLYKIMFLSFYKLMLLILCMLAWGKNSKVFLFLWSQEDYSICLHSDAIHNNSTRFSTGVEQQWGTTKFPPHH